MDFNTILQLLTEARQRDEDTPDNVTKVPSRRKEWGARRPDVDYTEVSAAKKRDKDAPPLAKGEKAEKVVVKVIAALKAQEASAFSRLTAKYEEIDKEMKDIIQRRDELNEDMRDELVELFDATDTVFTRVVDTASWTITLSKFEAGEDRPPVVATDYEAILKDLEGLLNDELKEKLVALKKAYTRTTVAKDNPSKLTVKNKAEEAAEKAAKKAAKDGKEELDEGLMASAKRWLSSLVSSITSWAKGYDRRLGRLKAEFDELKAS